MTGDPSQMTDEELDNIIENGLPLDEEAPDESTPPAEEPKEEEQEAPKEEEAPKETPEPPKEEEKQPSRREQLRVQQLLEKYGTQPAKSAPKEEAKPLDYRESLNAEDEIISELETDRANYGKAEYEKGVKTADDIRSSVLFHTRLELDAPVVEAKYKFLNKNDEENFNPAAAKAMNTKFLQFVGYDPATDTVRDSNTRYSEFVEAEMEFAKEIAQNEISSSTKNIAKQAAHTALRPDGSSAKRLNLNKAPQDMSNEELDAYLAQNNL